MVQLRHLGRSLVPGRSVFQCSALFGHCGRVSGVLSTLLHHSGTFSGDRQQPFSRGERMICRILQQELSSARLAHIPAKPRPPNLK